MRYVKWLSGYKTYVKVGTSIRWREIYIISKGQHVLQSTSSPFCAFGFIFFFFLTLLNFSLISNKKKSLKCVRETGNSWNDSSSIFLFLFSILNVLAPIPPLSWQHPCPDGLPPRPAPPRPLDHIRALLSSSLQFTLVTSGWCRTVLLLHLWASCSPGSRKYRHAPKPARTRTDTSR